MPYSYPDDIPEAIEKLPAHAQEIFVAAYNSAYEQYDGDEAKANATAWAAVKTKYEKVDDTWRVKAMEAWRFVDLLDGVKFSDGENPTSEVQLFKIGEWKGHPTGGFEITEDVIEKMVDNFEAGERDVVVDYQHLSLDGGPDEAKAAGWVKTLVNKGIDGLWATVEWTKKAAEMIKKKEYRYISPEFHLNYPSKETKKKMGALLMAVALTNRPFIEGMAPVALSERALAEIESVSLDEILEDIEAWLAKANAPLKGKKGSPAIRLYLKGVKEKIKGLIKKNKTLTEEEAEMLLAETLMKTTEGGEAMERKLLCDQLGLPETATDEVISAELKRLKETQGNKALAETLGLKEDATPAEVLESVGKLKEAGSQTTAEDTVKLAEFKQLKNDHAVTKKLAEGLKEDKDALNLKLLEKDRDEVIKKALTDGKLVPANKELWEKQYMANPEQTKALLEAQPIVLDLKERGSGGAGATGNAGEQINQKCSEKQAADKSLSLGDALKMVQLENPVLAKEYAKEIRA